MNAMNQTTPEQEPADDSTDSGTGEIRLTFFQKLESFAARLSTKSAFWNSVLALFLMPAVFLSGIRMRFTPEHFEAVLPFRRFNRNSYGTMAGAALLGNCEVAAGGYLFYASEGQFQIVCKKLSYSFRYSCNGPVKYVVALNDQVKELIAALKPFTIDLATEIYELDRKGAIKRKIGTAMTTFHARPIGYLRARQRRQLKSQ
ncbi:MAG TPA: hypothetical protein VIM96_06630 [Pseudomonadales bacterium]|jgi:hypothetical protein